MSLQPSLGRIVLFNMFESAIAPESRATRPAVVVHVRPDSVDLLVFGETTMFFKEVPEDRMLGDGGPEGRPFTWFWPPRVP